MTENPYDILGISPDATPEEVKRAYRKKARENHPDLNPDDPKAEERMNKVNEAYDRITNPEKYAASDARRRGQGVPYTPGYGYGPPGAGGVPGAGQYTWTTIDFEDFFGGGWATTSGTIHAQATASDPAPLRQAISYINAGAYAHALSILEDFPASKRTARWSYLFALANHGAGNAVAAQEHIRRARTMDPTNPDYARAEASFTRRAQAYAQEGTKRGFTSVGLDPNWICCCVCLGPSCCSWISRMLYYSGINF